MNETEKKTVPFDPPAPGSKRAVKQVRPKRPCIASTNAGVPSNLLGDGPVPPEYTGWLMKSNW